MNAIKLKRLQALEQKNKPAPVKKAVRLFTVIKPDGGVLVVGQGPDSEKNRLRSAALGREMAKNKKVLSKQEKASRRSENRAKRLAKQPSKGSGGGGKGKK